MVLLVISFIAGILTVLAPCVLPLLPVIVGGSLAGGSRRRAYTITASLALSIVAFTLLLKASTAFISVPEEIWRQLSGGIILLFGVLLLFPSLWTALPGINALSRSSNKLLAAGYQRGSFWGDVVMGAALGPVFASCSPTYFIILATVLPVQPLLGFLYLVVYAIGLSLMLLLIAVLGDRLIQKLGITIEPEGWFRRGIGALFVIVGLLVFTGTMRNLETWLVEQGLNPSFIEYQLLGEEENMSGVLPSEAVEALTPEAKALMYPKAPELVEPDGYINTPRLSSGQAAPITIGEFRGKNPVLIDIWTYSCINCQRTLPYLRTWYEKYEDDGLVIIGVHTPEFAFEKVLSNVEKAVNDFRLTYPVVLDNEYRTWNAFGNRFWPRKYLIDIDGYIVYDHAGEGDYEDTERAIQRVLAERAKRLGMDMPSEPVSSPADMIEVDFSQVRSPEIYFGSERNERLGNGERGTAGTQTLDIPVQLLGNTLYLGGVWDIEPEYAQNTGKNARITFTYGAKNVYMVASADASTVVRITVDGGKPLGSLRGRDVNEQGELTVHEDRLYTLIEGDGYETHVLEIMIQGEDLKAYTFTFG